MSEGPAAATRSEGEERDQFVTLRGVSWGDYEAFLRIVGESSAVRVTYLEGDLEIMGPSRTHEMQRKMLARLLEAYARELGVMLEGYGSFTVKNPDVERGAEADECYVVGPHDPESIEAPQIAVEVVWTSGGIDKLEVWRKLGAQEVWVWSRGSLKIHALEEEHYVPVARSNLLPTVDPTLLEHCMTEPTQTAAVATLLDRLRDR